MNEADRSTATMRRSAEQVITAVGACEASLRAGGTLLSCGNAGSADSQHLALSRALVELREARMVAFPS